jgi:Protein of unknown function (DUF3592)
MDPPGPLVIIVALLGIAGGLILSIWLNRHFRRFEQHCVARTTTLPKRARLRRQMLAWLILALVFGGIMGSLNLLRYTRLARQGLAVAATVVRTECHNHQTISYRFAAEGQAYTGSGNADACERLRPGDQVTAYYLPTNPETNSPGDVHQRLANEIITVALAATVFPSILVAVLHSRNIL